MNIVDREITKEELQAIYDDFKKIEIQDGLSQDESKRYNVVAEENGAVVGFASGLTQYEWFHLTDLWVHENHRRQGLGAKILKMLEDKIKPAGMRHVYTWTTGFINPKFYESQGYKAFTVFENYCGREGYHKVGYRKDFVELVIKPAKAEDLPRLLDLYTHLHNNPYPTITTEIENIWTRIINDPNHHILLGYIDEKLVTSCVVVIIENLTRGQRPYALIENVITHPDYRNRGHASLILDAAKDIAVKNNCYKIMLMTSAKQDSTLNFYRRAGYNSEDKTGFIQWL